MQCFVCYLCVVSSEPQPLSCRKHFSQGLTKSIKKLGVWIIRPPRGHDYVCHLGWHLAQWDTCSCEENKEPPASREAIVNQGPLSNQERIWNGSFTSSHVIVLLTNIWPVIFRGIWNVSPLDATIKELLKLSFPCFRPSLNWFNYHWENKQIRQSAFQVLPLSFH